ncbi:MAG: replication restart helicase PriA, partial [Candidatus Saccharimonadales bacterium]
GDSPTKLKTTIVDFHDRSLFNRSAHISQPLVEAIESALTERLQVLLYLNRRGTARVIICDSCDWQARCPRCDLALTYHGDSHTLRCHSCGFSSRGPITCPQCGHPTIKYLSIGTKAVVAEIERLFPSAKVRRFDSDNAKAERLEQNYELIKAGSVDIIVGTQLLAKGLDLPKLSVVGVLLADTSLQLPDFSANERTFELLEQVIGRVGRGHVAGSAIIQTYQPENQIILDALVDDWPDFYARELKERREYGFPPFVHLLKLSVQRATPLSAETAAEKLKAELSKKATVEGPAPAFHELHDGKSRWQLIVKSRRRGNLIDIIEHLPSGWSYDIDPSDLI